MRLECSATKAYSRTSLQPSILELLKKVFYFKRKKRGLVKEMDIQIHEKEKEKQYDSIIGDACTYDHK